jgi:membrane protease YdiL (CAAX protease family)
MNTPEAPLPPAEPASDSLGDAAAAPAASGIAPGESTLPEDLRAPWGWKDLLFLLLFFLASSVVLTWAVELGALIWFGVRPWDIDKSVSTKAMIVVISQGLVSGGSLLYLFAVVRLRHRGPFWQTIGWRKLHPRHMTPEVAPLVYVLGGMALALAIQTASLLVGKRTKLPIEEFFRDRRSVLLLMALGILVAPLVEETIFRGYIYPVVARRFGVGAGVLATGTLFGIAHAGQLWGGWGQIVLLVVVGVVLTYVRARTGTVLASYFFHLGYNTILFAGFYFATGGLHNLPGNS